MEMRRYVIFLINILICSGRIDYVFLHNVKEGSSTQSEPVRHPRSAHGHAKGKTNDDNDLRKAVARNEEMKERLSDLWLPAVHKIWMYWHTSGARKAMSAITSKLIQHASEHLTRHVGRIIRSTLLNSDMAAISSTPTTFVNAPPIGPMETLSINIKGRVQTYKNFSKPLNDDDIFKSNKVLNFARSSANIHQDLTGHEDADLRDAFADEVNLKIKSLTQKPVAKAMLSTGSGEDDVSSGDGITGKLDNAQNKTRRKKKKHVFDSAVNISSKARPMNGSAAGRLAVANAVHEGKKKKKHNRNRYKVYSGATGTNPSTKDDRYRAGYGTRVSNVSSTPFANVTTKLSFPQWVETYSGDGASIRNKSTRHGVLSDHLGEHTTTFTMGHNDVVEVPHSNPVVDPLHATHAGDVGIHHGAPQDSLKEGHEQGPLPPGHEQGPKLPGHEKGPLLPGHEKGPLLPGQSHAGNFTHHEDSNVGPLVEDKLPGQCSPCLGQHNLGVPLVFEQDGSFHCEPCHGHKVGLSGKLPGIMDHTQWNPHLHPLGAVYNHEPFQLLVPTEANPSIAPINLSNEYPFNPPNPHTGPLPDGMVEGPPTDVLSHSEFEKLGHDLNPGLLSVIEHNSQKISSLWNEVKNVESRLGNIESVIEVVEKAVQKIEAKLDLVEDNTGGMYVDDPFHQQTLKIKIPNQVGRPYPAYPAIGEYLDTHVTDGFPHNPHHSPVLKQYFIPMQPNSVEGMKEIDRVPMNAGLPWPVSKFLGFLLQELQKDKNSQQTEPIQLQSTPRVPHVPLPQPDLPYPPKEHDIERLEYEIGRLPKPNRIGQKTYHPEVEEPAICQCENGGQCNGRSECDCPIRYTGARCERPVPRSPLLDSIIDDMPTDVRQFRGPRQSGQLITLPLVVSDKDDQETADQKAVGEVNQARLVNLLSQFFSPEYLQRLAKRQKVNVRRYVKYPVEKET